MKKIISLMIAIFSIFMVSCNNTKVLEENTKNNEILNKYKITERNININYEDRVFEPLFYDEDGVNGILNTRKIGTVSEDEINIPYIINETGELIKEENKWFVKEGSNFIRATGRFNFRGVYSEGLHTRDQTFYYIDLEKNIKIKLDSYDKTYYELYDSFERRDGSSFQIGDDYYIEETYKLKEDYELEEEKSILIVDIKNETYYTTGIIKMESNKFYYDEIEKSIMSLDNLGKIRKVILRDKKIYFEDYKTIDLSEIGIESLFGNKSPRMSRYYKSEDNLIFEVRDKERFKYILYNLNTNDIKFINEEVFIKNQIEDTKFFVVSSNNKVYLAEIGDNYDFDLIYRVSEVENYDKVMTKANKDGSSIFFSLESFDHSEGKNSILKDSKYFFLEIEEK